MSGTSLDGLDIAYCRFTESSVGFDFELVGYNTIKYSEAWIERLRFAHHLLPRDFALLNADYGFYLGQRVKEFVIEEKIEVDFIASHGHTIFHEPDSFFTTQIGSGAHIAVASGLETICDFRTNDVALGGNGAPLVPIGDGFLFSEYDYCLNLGGFANVSSLVAGQRRAYDICPANLVLNYLSKRKGLEFDRSGEIASQGELVPELFDALNQKDFYSIIGPKSLGREWVESEILPLLADDSVLVQDYLHTFCHHIAYQVAQSIATGKVLITGGGAYNDFLIHCFREYFADDVQVVIPQNSIVEFKEALIFAFLGVLRKREETNVLCSVTGAKRDNIGGCIYLP